MPGHDAPGLPLIADDGAIACSEAASLKSNQRRMRIRQAGISRVSLLAASRTTSRKSRARAEMKAQEIKFKSFGSGCRFDEDGLGLIESDSELQKILSIGEDKLYLTTSLDNFPAS